MWRAPGRANLIGEHTDYNDGFVSRSRWTGAPWPRPQRRALAFWSSARGRWARYVTVPLAGLAPGTVTAGRLPGRWCGRCGKAGYELPGAAWTSTPTCRRGGALLVAALECAVALALTELAGLTVPRPELAAIARRTENDFVGVPTGIMDQSAVLLCQAGHALLLDCAAPGRQRAARPGAAGWPC